MRYGYHSGPYGVATSTLYPRRDELELEPRPHAVQHLQLEAVASDALPLGERRGTADQGLVVRRDRRVAAAAQRRLDEPGVRGVDVRLRACTRSPAARGRRPSRSGGSARAGAATRGRSPSGRGTTAARCRPARGPPRATGGRSGASRRRRSTAPCRCGRSSPARSATRTTRSTLAYASSSSSSRPRCVSFSATLHRQLLRVQPLEDPAVLVGHRLGLRAVADALAEQRRVRVEALIRETPQRDDALVERLAGDEAGRPEAHAVAAHEPLDVPVVGRAEDPRAQHGVRPRRGAHAVARSDLSREPVLELGDLALVQVAERRPHVRADGHALPADHPLEGGVPRERLDARRAAPRARPHPPRSARARPPRPPRGTPTPAPTPRRRHRPRGRGG